jgi:hypothetical protein
MRFCGRSGIGLLAFSSLLVGMSPLVGQRAATPSGVSQASSASAPATEIQATLSQALKSLEAMDLQGVLAYVSDQYQSGPLSKALIRQELETTFALYDAMQARVRVDEIRAVGDEAVIVTTGAVQGRLRLVGSWTPLLSWAHQSEVLRRERGVWRAYGDHKQR